MLLFATLSAENPNGKPGLLTISLSNEGSGFTLPVFNWLTVSARQVKGVEGYALTNLRNWLAYDTYAWGSVRCYNDCDGSWSNDAIEIRDIDIIDLSEESISVSLDFHIQLWK